MSRVGLLLLLALLCGGAACTRNTSGLEGAAPGTARPERASARRLNAPALVGRSIDQVRRQLGPPRETAAQAVGLEPTAQQLRATKGEGWINTFEKDGTTIIVTFNARTREVRDFVLLGDNEEELTRRAGLQLVDEDYLVLPVADPAAPSKIIGVRVVKR
ncbi:hypothetical protein EJV47_17655 [Hymenobacter gummosus]|uniref:Uncharacterized protein n=1 Tax=Hymenobacter gummosus TaxID=1776032 RepID=A0A3S0HLD7_9BACT|nr:hypothetical protein [Hymenobacter gummosus]RTQ47746.1 hypothetical protein EJV47_17655 [Hymenobacter gummosus]